MTERSSTTRPDATLGKAPTSTEAYDTHLTTELEDALTYLRQHGTEGILDRLTITADAVHLDREEVPRLLADLFVDYLRAVVLMSDREAESLRQMPPADGLALARRVLLERSAR